MKKIIKTMPLMALLLGAGIFTVDAAFKASTVQTDQDWMLNPNGDPLEPTDYTSVPNGSSTCQQVESTVCAVIAPADPNDSNVPFLDTELREALESPSLEHDKIIKGPRIQP